MRKNQVKSKWQNSTCKNSSRIFFFFFNAKTEFFVSAHRSTSCHNSLTSDRLARTCLLGPRVFVYSWRTSTYDLSKTRRNGTANEDSTLFFSREISMGTPNSWKSGSKDTRITNLRFIQTISNKWTSVFVWTVWKCRGRFSPALVADLWMKFWKGEE